MATTLRLNRGVDKKPRHGACKVLFTVDAPGTEMTLVEKIRHDRAVAMCHKIDGDFKRGGFSSYPRHAR